MWLFGGGFFSKSPRPEVSLSQINVLLETWGPESYRNEFLIELCYSGIPLCYRGTIWNLLVGNHLQITPELYTIFKERSVQLSTRSEKAGESLEEVDLEAGNMHGKEDSMSIIRYDVPRTFADMEEFHNGGPLAETLELILQTYACYRPDVGYVQGMSYLAGMLVYYLDEFSAFRCLANILGRRLSFDFYQLKEDPIAQFTSTFSFFFQLNLPELHRHFSEESVGADIFLLDWTMTLFSKTFSVDIAARLWDVFLLEGEVFVLRAAIGILSLHREVLSTLEAAPLLRFLRNPPAGSTCPDQLLTHIRQQVHISREAYEAVMAKHRVPSCLLGLDRAARMAPVTGGEASADSCSTSSFVHSLCPPFGPGGS